MYQQRSHGRRGMRDWIRGNAGTLLLLTIVLATLTGCQREDPRLIGLQRLESASPSPADTEELEAVIEEYGRVVSEKIEAGIRQAQYLKLLAHEYLRNQMYGLSLSALQDAIDLEPENQILQELAGASAAYMAKAQGDEQAREHYFSMAESYYLRAIELTPDYREANYGLAVLYVFELDEPLEALPYIEHVLEITPDDVDALFVLANANVAIGDFDAAIEAYDRIIRVADDAGSKERAAQNRQLLLGGES